MKLNQSAKKALSIGILSALSYLAVYIARNALSTVTPQIIENGKYTNENFGTFSSFLGSPVAGVWAIFLLWQDVFSTISVILISMGIICFIVFTVFEKKGIIQYNYRENSRQLGLGLKLLFKNHIIKFTIISILTGVVRTTVVFWLPTYLTQQLSFSPKFSAVIFTGATIFISLSSFVSVFVYEKLNQNMNLTILLSFALSAASFLFVFFFSNSILNTVFLMLAIFAADSA